MLPALIGELKSGEGFFEVFSVAQFGEFCLAVKARQGVKRNANATQQQNVTNKTKGIFFYIPEKYEDSITFALLTPPLNTGENRRFDQCI